MSNGKCTSSSLLLQPIVYCNEMSMLLTAQQLGLRIRLAREAKGLSQEEFAVLIDRDQRSVSEYENGKRRIFAQDLPRIARALDVTILYFFEDIAQPDDLDQVLLREFRRLNQTGQQTLIQMARLLDDLINAEPPTSS